jgi:hypothetical protein
MQPTEMRLRKNSPDTLNFAQNRRVQNFSGSIFGSFHRPFSTGLLRSPVWPTTLIGGARNASAEHEQKVN